MLLSFLLRLMWKYFDLLRAAPQILTAILCQWTYYSYYYVRFTTEYKQSSNDHFLWRTFHHDGKFSPHWWEGGQALPLSLYLPSRGGGGARPPPFTLSTITSKVVVYASADRADALPLFLLCTYMYSVEFTMKMIVHWSKVYYMDNYSFGIVCNM